MSYRIHRENRTSIDLDTFNQLQMLKIFFNAKRIFEHVLVYETEGGYHIQIYTPKRSSKTNMIVRMLLGDCEGRMDLDVKRLRHGLDDLIETLFKNKRIYWYSSSEMMVDPLAKPFWGNSYPYNGGSSS